jgi:hypothetical protein
LASISSVIFISIEKSDASATASKTCFIDHRITRSAVTPHGGMMRWPTKIKPMKNTLHSSICTLVLAGSFILSSAAIAQRVEATSSITTFEGTISEFGPQAIVIKTSSGTVPVRYLSNQTTNNVDENGNPVSLATVTSGLPVTVYYTKVGDTLVASKIMVRRIGSVAPVTVISTPAITLETTTTTAGTITDFTPGKLLINTETSASPLTYVYSKTTTYVDENGVPISIKTVKSDLPVTVYYTQVGDSLTATKVIVRKAPLIEETKTTTTTTEIKR